MRKFLLAAFICGFFFDTGFAQSSETNPRCDHNAILAVIRAYEDSLALAKSIPVVREDYTLPASNPSTSGNKQYKLYRCPALLDSLEVLINEVELARATTAAVFTCSTSTVNYDGYDYPIVLIGSQCWFAEDLRNDNYADGTAIPGGLDNDTWLTTTAGAFTIYGEGGANESTNLATYGRLYNWYAVDNAAGLCPTGWRAPSGADWTTLETQLGGASGAGVQMKAASPIWNGTNSSGFNGLPAGYRDGYDGLFRGNEGGTGWWSSSPLVGGKANLRYVYSQSSELGSQDTRPRYGYAVRCIQDAIPASAPTVDTDAATGVGVTTATLHATFTDGGSAVTATGFKYGTDAGLTSPADVAGVGTSSPFTAALTGLTAGTQYWAVGYATNAVGTSYGDTIAFTTTAGPFTCGTSSVTYDEHAYATVLIGSQCWFAENLRNDNYANGTAIPGGLDATAWSGATTGAFTIHDEGGANEATNLATYGRLYNWYAVNDAAGLCPTGWHVPADAEWTTLSTAFGGEGVAGLELKSNSGWDPGEQGTNSSGFTGLPGGRRLNDGTYNSLGQAGYWWTSTEDEVRALNRVLNGTSNLNWFSASRKRGFSVRCVKDPIFAPTVDTEAATGVGETTATLRATFTDGGSTVTAKGFKYGTDAGLTSPADVSGVGTSSPFTAALTGLTASTQYWAVGYATNEEGTSYGDTIAFTTTAAPVFNCGSSFVTYDGDNYPTVLIGSQCWFKENLRNDNYANGTAIPGGLDDAAWSATTSGAQAPGNNDQWSLFYFGRLYNWYAVNDAAGLCPTGWHVPTDAEWTTLENQLGGAAVAGQLLKNSLPFLTATPVDWDGNNESGFAAFPIGQRDLDGQFAGYSGEGYWWSSTSEGGNAIGRGLRSWSNTVDRLNKAPRHGYSVRCLKDPSSAPTVDTDAATGVGETTATLSATFTDGGSAVTATGFKYGTDAGLTSPADVAGDGTSSPFTAALTGLTAGTQYWAVGYATNAVGTSYGDTVTFTTTAAAGAFTCGTSSVTYDEHAYATVLIGSQCWFAENLRNDNYANGTAIPGGLDDASWSGATSGAQAVYNGDEAANLATYGRLYNWYAVTDAAGLCPTGWHVPTDAEWTTLENQLGGASVAGAAMKSVSWDGTNTSGFSGLPAGGRSSNGSFFNLGSYGYWRSSSPNGGLTITRYLFSGDSFVNRSDGSNPQNGFSVRCIQDAIPASAPTVDTDAATGVGETTATLSATFTDGGSAVTATGFKYGTDAGLTSPADVAGDGTTSPFTAALTGLTAGTQYWAVGYATNAVGTSYGDTIAFTTTAAAGAFTCGTSTVTYDEHAYATVLIGSQCWFAENLRNDNYANGTAIPGGLDATAWSGATSGAQAVYNGDETNLATYGRLYNWYAVTDAAGLCPTGWHVPTDAEWTTLENQLGGASVAGAAMKSVSWDGTNTSGFSGLPAGYRYGNGGFYDLGLFGAWWSSSPDGGGAIDRYLYSGGSSVDRNYNDGPRNGFSVRCVRD